MSDAPPVPKPWEIILITGPNTESVRGGAVRRKLAFRIQGVDDAYVTVRLDSEISIARQAKTWSIRYQLPYEEIEASLRSLAVRVGHAIHRLHIARDEPETPAKPITPKTVLEVWPVFNRWLIELDPALLDVVFGALLAHRIDGDPVWLFVVGAPGDGKTEMLRSASANQGVMMISTLTPASLISGYEEEGMPDPSLLPKLDGKVLIIKDFTAVLSMRREDRAEVLGTLRDAYDGEASKAFGNCMRAYKSRFGLIAAVTPAIEDSWTTEAALGERFIRFRLQGEGRLEKARQAMTNANTETAMRRELSEAAQAVLALAVTHPTLPNAMEDNLVVLADLVALLRSPIARDSDGVIRHVPAPEVGTRCGKSLKKLAMGIAMARGEQAVTDDIYRIIRRVALDSIPSMRGRLIRVLWDCRLGCELTSIIGTYAEISTETAKTWLDDLRLLGAVARRGEGHGTGYSWQLTPEIQVAIQQAGLLEA